MIHLPQLFGFEGTGDWRLYIGVWTGGRAIVGSFHSITVFVADTHGRAGLHFTQTTAAGQLARTFSIWVRGDPCQQTAMVRIWYSKGETWENTQATVICMQQSSIYSVFHSTFAHHFASLQLVMLWNGKLKKCRQGPTSANAVWHTAKTRGDDGQTKRSLVPDSQMWRFSAFLCHKWSDKTNVAFSPGRLWREFSLHSDILQDRKMTESVIKDW